MHILVCVKQVSGSNNVKVDSVTGVLVRSGVESKMNPYDLYGVETALSVILLAIRVKKSYYKIYIRIRSEYTWNTEF